MKFPVLQLTFPSASPIRFSLRYGYFDKSDAAQSVFHLYAIKKKEKKMCQFLNNFVIDQSRLTVDVLRTPY